MADKPSVQVMAPEASARDFANLEGDDFIKAIGFTPESEVKKAEEAKPENKIEEIATAVTEAKPEEKKVEEKPAEAAKTEEVKPEEKQGEEAKPEEKPAEERKLLTEFQVFDHEGELEVPDLKFTYKANGKIYEDVPLDKVVLMAQMGHYNHEREQKVTEQQNVAVAVQSENQQLRALIEEQAGQLRKALDNPDYYEAARQKWLEEQTPEAEARRLRQENENLKVQQFEERYAATLTGFVQQNVAPAMDALLKENPTVNEHELMGRYTVLTTPLLVRGRLPVERIPQVDALVKNELAQWVRAIHAERTAGLAATQKVVERAQIETAKAKRNMSRAVTPPPAAGVAGVNVSPNQTFDSAKDWLQKVLPVAQE